MSLSKKLPPGTHSDLSNAEPSSQLAVQTTFRHMATSPAVVSRIDAEAQKLLRYFERITHCHVVICVSHRHHRHGRHYTVRVELGVPGAHLVIDHEPAAHVRDEARPATKHTEVQNQHSDIYVVIREVFDSARRKLEDYVRRQRDEMKHEQVDPEWER